MALPADFPRQLPLLLAFDLDGTLIADGSQELPPDTAEALGRLRPLGVKLAIITGRDAPPASVSAGVQPHAVATNNGGRVVIGDQLHSEARFDAEDLAGVLAHELGDARVILFDSRHIYVDLPGDTRPDPWMVARAYRPISEAPKEGIVKVGFYHPNITEHAERLRRSHPHLVLTGGQPPYSEFLTVTPTGAHKAAALSLIAQALEVPMERAVAFGDSDNDEVMLEIAGYPVQVGDLPLLRPHARVQLPDHRALAGFLNELAEGLEQRPCAF